MAPEIRAFWQENEGKNYATNLVLVFVDSLHCIHDFLDRDGPENDAYYLELYIYNTIWAAE